MLTTRNSLSALGPALRDDFLFPIEHQFNQIFDQFFQRDFKGLKDSLKSTQGYPKLDIIEDENYLLIKVAVPGMDLNDISVILQSDGNEKFVEIAGKMNEEHGPVDENSATYLVRELRRSHFKRIIRLPEYAKDEPEAELKNGILTLSWQIPRETNKIHDCKCIEIKQGK